MNKFNISTFVLMLFIPAVMITYLSMPPKPSFKKGDCLILIKKDKEHWEQPTTFRYRIKEVGRSNYLVEFFSINNKNSSIDTMLSFKGDKHYYQKIDCSL